MPAAFDVLTRRALPSERTVSLWVSSTTGSDTAAGTAEAPLASTEEAMGRLPSIMWGRRAVVTYLPGHDEVVPRALFFPPIMGAGHLDDIGFDAADPSWDFQRSQIQFQAAPSVVEAVAGTITTNDATSQLITITDATKAWTTNQHAGRIVTRPGAIAEYGQIWGNNATQLFVCVIGGALTNGNVMIGDRTARLTLGSAEDYVQTGLTMAATTAAVGFVGLKIRGTAGAAGPTVDIVSQAGAAFLLCEIEGGIQLRPGSGVVSLDGCYLHGGALALNGQPMALRGSYLSGMTTNYHGSGGAGLFDIFGCRVIGCGALGHGGTSLPDGGFSIDQTWISNGTGHGIAYSGGNRARVRKTRIDLCAGNAINADGCGNLRLDTVTGTGSAGFGCFIDNGAHVVPVGATVAGAQGQVRLGPANYDWTEGPQVSATRLCRFGV